VREHTLQRVPFLLIIGDKEQENGEVSVRTREGKDLGSMPLEGFISLLNSAISLRGRIEENDK
jgi:threonyl-tRNA synthetase